jgi:Trp operon repressor
MYDQLAELFLANTQKRAFAKTLFEILTPAERIMLAKRVGIIGMLTYGHSVREISTTFKVSTSTIFLLSEQMSAKNFTHVVEIFKRKKYRQSFLGILETIVTVGGIAPNPQKKLREKVRRDIEAFRAGG